MVSANAEKPRLGGAMASIRTAYTTMQPAEHRVAEYILAHPQDIIHMPIAELASQAQVSEGTVVRFCQTAGYKGYQSLKIALAADLALSDGMVLEKARPSDDMRTLAAKVFQADIDAVKDTLRILDPQALERARQALLEARNIEFFAIGTSFPIALDAYNRFLRVGLPVHINSDAHFQTMTASLLGPGDLAFAVSHSGQSLEPVNCLRVAKERKATTVSITGAVHSLITQYSDIVLVAVSSESAYREEAMASRIAQLSLIDTLYVSIALQRPEMFLAANQAVTDALVSLKY